MDPQQPAADPALDSILQSLRQYAPPQNYHTTPVPTSSLVVPQASSTRPRSSTPQTTVAKGVTRSSLDPSKITEWAAAQKYVTFTLAQNQEATARIRKIIKSQHNHERQWWAGREALVSKLNNRAEGRRKADEILKSMGGHNTSVSEATTTPSSDDHAAELHQHDLKIHKALTDMVRATDAELRALGVPFFAIRHDLVSQDSDQAKETEKDGVRILNKKELQDSQKQVVQLLEDLFAG